MICASLAYPFDLIGYYINRRTYLELKNLKKNNEGIPTNSVEKSYFHVFFFLLFT